MTDAAREDRPPAFIPEMDGLRGYLTIAVLFHHIFTSIYWILPPAAVAHWDAFVPIIAGSEIALPVYFAISGFVIFLPAARGDGTIRDIPWYAVRRIARIVPGYYLMLIILVLIWPFVYPDTPSPAASERGIELLFGHFVFLQKVLFEETDIGFGMNGSTWTLTIEEFFYITLPLAAALLFRRPFRYLALALAITLVWKAGCLFLPEISTAMGFEPPDAKLPHHLAHQFPAYLFQFACGSVAAKCYVLLWPRLRNAKERTKRWLLALHLFCGALILFYVYYAGASRATHNGVMIDLQRDMTPAAAFAVLVIAVVYGPAWARKIYANRLAKFLGDTSFGVYLWHMIIIQIVWREADLPNATAEEAALVMAAWVLPGSMLLGWLSVTFVERPASELIRRVWKERARAASPA